LCPLRIRQPDNEDHERHRGDHRAGEPLRAGETGNPFLNETIPGVKFDLATTVLRREADAGRVGILTAVLD